MLTMTPIMYRLFGVILYLPVAIVLFTLQILAICFYTLRSLIDWIIHGEVLVDIMEPMEWGMELQDWWLEKCEEEEIEINE